MIHRLDMNESNSIDIILQEESRRVDDLSKSGSGMNFLDEQCSQISQNWDHISSLPNGMHQTTWDYNIKSTKNRENFEKSNDYLATVAISKNIDKEPTKQEEEEYKGDKDVKNIKDDIDYLYNKIHSMSSEKNLFPPPKSSPEKLKLDLGKNDRSISTKKTQPDEMIISPSRKFRNQEINPYGNQISSSKYIYSAADDGKTNFQYFKEYDNSKYTNSPRKKVDFKTVSEMIGPPNPPKNPKERLSKLREKNFRMRSEIMEIQKQIMVEKMENQRLEEALDRSSQSLTYYKSRH